MLNVTSFSDSAIKELEPPSPTRRNAIHSQSQTAEEVTCAQEKVLNELITSPRQFDGPHNHTKEAPPKRKNGVVAFDRSKSVPAIRVTGVGVRSGDENNVGKSKRKQSVFNRSVSNLENGHMSDKVHADNAAKSETPMNRSVSDISKENGDPIDKVSGNDSLVHSDKSAGDSTTTYGSDVLVRAVGQVISLPPVYKIDSQSYQDAERARTISRSKSRVSFSSNLASASDGHGSNNMSNARADRSPVDMSKSETNQTDTDNHVSDNVGCENEKPRNTYSRERSKTGLTLPAEVFEDERIRQYTEVVYKGRVLKNYIHPQDRYKLDPIVVKRRQNKMDRLAKESVSFLKRVNHENINVEIAFPRSARRRVLNQLVEENNAGKSYKVNDEDELQIRERMEYFMDSIGEYIRQQQLERDKEYVPPQQQPMVDATAVTSE